MKSPEMKLVSSLSNPSQHRNSDNPDTEIAPSKLKDEIISEEIKTGSPSIENELLLKTLDRNLFNDKETKNSLVVDEQINTLKSTEEKTLGDYETDSESDRLSISVNSIGSKESVDETTKTTVKHLLSSPDINVSVEAETDILQVSESETLSISTNLSVSMESIDENSKLPVENGLNSPDVNVPMERKTETLLEDKKNKSFKVIDEGVLGEENETFDQCGSMKSMNGNRKATLQKLCKTPNKCDSTKKTSQNRVKKNIKTLREPLHECLMENSICELLMKSPESSISDEHETLTNTSGASEETTSESEISDSDTCTPLKSRDDDRLFVGTNIENPENEEIPLKIHDECVSEVRQLRNRKIAVNTKQTSHSRTSFKRIRKEPESGIKSEESTTEQLQSCKTSISDTENSDISEINFKAKKAVATVPPRNSMALRKTLDSDEKIMSLIICNTKPHEENINQGDESEAFSKTIPQPNCEERNVIIQESTVETLTSRETRVSDNTETFENQRTTNTNSVETKLSLEATDDTLYYISGDYIFDPFSSSDNETALMFLREKELNVTNIHNNSEDQTNLEELSNITEAKQKIMSNNSSMSKINTLDRFNSDNKPSIKKDLLENSKVCTEDQKKLYDNEELEISKTVPLKHHIPISTLISRPLSKRPRTSRVNGDSYKIPKVDKMNSVSDADISVKKNCGQKENTDANYSSTTKDFYSAKFESPEKSFNLETSQQIFQCKYLF